MIRDVGSSLARHAALIALVLMTGLSSALAERVQPVERVAPLEQTGQVVEPPADVSELRSRPIGERLTDYETMELHLRRYSAAANNMAQLFKQLNQKIQEVSLAAKTVEAKNTTNNRRLLEDKLRQLENMRASFSGQHAQLQSQMQNEYRSYAALSSNLKVKYDRLEELQTKVDAAKTAREAREAKEAKSTKGKQTKPKDSTVKDPKDAQGTESKTRQDLKSTDPATTPATNPGSSAKPASGAVEGPILRNVH
jgi:septal ring factor EnvC (AmiA/AmiB activator)